MAGAPAAAARIYGRFDGTAWLAVPAVLWLAIAFLAPLLLLLTVSFLGPGGASFAPFAEVLGDPYYRGIIWNTVAYAVPVTVACLLIAYPFAFAMAAMGRAAQTVCLVATLLPLTASVIVKTFGWTILLRTTGVLNRSLLGLGLIDEPLRILFTQTGLYLGTINILLPFMVLPIFAVARQIDRSLYDAAATLGSGPLGRFRRVALPLSLPGVVAGSSIVFSLATSAYVIPTLLIGERQKVLSKLVAHNYLVVNKPALGAALAVILLAITVSAVLLAARFGRRAKP
jgi:putative spermidine/putrescine transport system permease protein